MPKSSNLTSKERQVVELIAMAKPPKKQLTS